MADIEEYLDIIENEKKGSIVKDAFRNALSDVNDDLIETKRRIVDIYGLKVESMTAAQYNEIVTPDPKTIYTITDSRIIWYDGVQYGGGGSAKYAEPFALGPNLKYVYTPDTIIPTINTSVNHYFYMEEASDNEN